ncbi:hypothetical protein MMC08_001642 [Hypocenomyce scalaris]|nr:hypothetical protein [Hypocenomyce scalaris]
MGGFIDTNLYHLQSALAQDIGSDFNLFADPEAAHIAPHRPLPLHHPRPRRRRPAIPLQQLLDIILTSAATTGNSYAALMKNYDITYPLWDETAAAIRALPHLVTENTLAYEDVNAASDCPDLGRAYLWSEEFAPIIRGV